MRFLALLALLFASASLQAIPLWGAKTSSPADTAPADLKPGQWIWSGDRKAHGPMAVIISLTEQRAYVYRNGVLVAVSTVSTGKKGYDTPVGVFTILQKDKAHVSNKYNSAPMPYQQRLTWDGVALHAGGLPGYPESHGCVHLPSKFAQLLFDSTNIGMTVVVAEEGKSSVNVAHPSAIVPIEPLTGAEASPLQLRSGETFRWTPEMSPDGPVSIVISRSDELMVVYRNGREIGRTQIAVAPDRPVTGTHAYIVADGFMDMQVPDLPGTRMPKWIAIGIPGHEDEANRELDPATVSSIEVPKDFAALVLPLLTPGVVVLATDARISADPTPERMEVLDSSPPDPVTPK